MTTITIEENIEGLSKMEFKTLAELFNTLREMAPIKLYQDDEESFSEETIKKIKQSKNNPNKKLTDFQG